MAHENRRRAGEREAGSGPDAGRGCRTAERLQAASALRPLFETWNVRVVSEGGWEDDTRRLMTEIADATCLPVGPDLEQLLRDVGATQQRLRKLEETRQLQSDQIDALGRGLDDLTPQFSEASAAERPALADAFAELAQGSAAKRWPPRPTIPRPPVCSATR